MWIGQVVCFDGSGGLQVLVYQQMGNLPAFFLLLATRLFQKSAHLSLDPAAPFGGSLGTMSALWHKIASQTISNDAVKGTVNFTDIGWS